MGETWEKGDGDGYGEVGGKEAGWVEEGKWEGALTLGWLSHARYFKPSLLAFI